MAGAVGGAEGCRAACQDAHTTQKSAATEVSFQKRVAIQRFELMFLEIRR